MMSQKKVSVLFKACLTESNSLQVTTFQDVRLELAQEEGLQLASGHAPQHEVTMMGYFSMGFNIEDQQ